MNHKKNSNNASSSTTTSSSQQQHRLSNNNQAYNNSKSSSRAFVKRDAECNNSSFLSISPGTKLIQTWIQRIQAPQLFEGLLVSPASSSSTTTIMMNNQDHHQPQNKKESSTNNNTTGVRLLFVNLPSMSSTSSSTLPHSEDLVLFIFMLWSYLTKSFGFLRFFDSLYKKIVLEFFWGSFVMKFLAGKEDNNRNNKNNSRKQEKQQQHDENYISSRPLIINLIENIGKTM